MSTFEHETVFTLDNSHRDNKRAHHQQHACHGVQSLINSMDRDLSVTVSGCSADHLRSHFNGHKLTAKAEHHTATNYKQTGYSSKLDKVSDRLRGMCSIVAADILIRARS
jgi:hypothetical protein